MKKKRKLCAILGLFLSLSFQAYAKETPKELSRLYAQSAVLMDADSGRVLFEKAGYEKRAMASTTKIMTLIVALENEDPGELVTISKKAASQPDVQLGVREGEVYRLEDLLYSLMLESHNDAAVAIAEQTGGTVEGFAALMNAKARDIGCFDTYYITPNGLDAKDEKGVHSTTAADLARVLRYCISISPKREEFLTITRTASHSFGDTEGLRSFTVNNHNAFLGMMDGALSGKTGFTGQAGYCYVGALKREGRTFIVALLACGWPNNKGYKWKDTRRLMDYALETYTYEDVWQDVFFEPIRVEGGVPEDEDWTGEARLRVELSKGEEGLRLLLGSEEEVSVEAFLPKMLEAPVERGSLVGSVRYYLNGEMVGIYAVQAGESVKKRDGLWCIQKLTEKYML